MNQWPSRWLALLGSLISPGLGHLYAGFPRRALLWALTGIVLGPTTLWVSLAVLTGLPAILMLASVPLAMLILPALSAWRAASQGGTYHPTSPMVRWLGYFGFWAAAAGMSKYVALPLVREHYRAFRIPSAAMEPTLLIGDFLFVHFTSPSFDPPHGTIVVFDSPEEPGLQVIKRVVGRPGDTLSMTFTTLTRNGVPLTEPYVQHEDPSKSESPEYRGKMRAWQLGYLTASDTTGYSPDVSAWGPLVVPKDSLFVLGDNREGTYDSRYFGWVSRDRILGTPRLMYYSYDPLCPRLLPPLTCTRWRRIGLTFH